MDMQETKLIAAAVTAEVISLSGKYEVPDLARGKVALLSDFTLLVSDSYKRDNAVNAYKNLLDRSDLEYVVKYVSIEDIKTANENVAVISGPTSRSVDVSDVQRDAIKLIGEAVKEGATDIHILNYPDTCLVKFRIHGVLFVVHKFEPDAGVALCRCIYGSMTDVGDGNFNDRLPQDARLDRKYVASLGLNGARIATRPMEKGNFFALRLLYQGDAKQKTLRVLGYNARQEAIIRQMLRRKGVNIFSGVTGSGKSTSLQVVLLMLLALHENGINLLTVEQPLEYVIPGAVQTPLTGDLDDAEAVLREWARAISNLMRLDPDYLMVGELRDLASAIAAIQAAMTGHGMWTTTHAKDAFSTLDRLADLGVPVARLTDASLFTGIVNQALAPVLCPHCKRRYKNHMSAVPADLQERIKKFCMPAGVYIRGNQPDCVPCKGRGVVARTVVAETVLTTQALMNVYRSGGSSAARSYWVNHMNGVTKCQHLTQKINEGLVDPAMGEEAICGLDEDSLNIVV